MARKLNQQKYCGWCGGKISYTVDWASKCTSCGYKNYQNPNPCSSVMLIRDGRVLMVRRNIEPRLGKLDLPGGFMDMTDNTIEESVYRELLEEVGVVDSEVSELQYLGSHTTPYVWMNTELNNICSFFSCELRDNVDIQLDTSENSEFVWISADDLPKIDFAWDIDRQMLEKYFQEVA